MSGKKAEIYVLHGKNVLRSCDGMVPKNTEDTIALSMEAMDRKTIGIVCPKCGAMNRLSIGIFPAMFTNGMIRCQNKILGCDRYIAYGPTPSEDPEGENVKECPMCEEEKAASSK